MDTDQSLDDNYVLTDCVYQELDNANRDFENVYDVATTSKPKGRRKKVKKQPKKLYSETKVSKCLVTAIIIVSCIAVVSTVIAIAALVVAVIALTNNQDSSQHQLSATISIPPR